MLTFDDAYVNFLEHALPILKQYGFSGTVFVATGEVGGRSRWDVGYESPTMSWPQLRELHEAGIECASHTVSHPWLSKLPEAAVREELTRSREQLQEELGAAVQTIAYPYGDTNERVAAAAGEAGYELACTIERGNRHAPSERLLLRRVPMAQFTTISRLRYRLSRLYDYTCRFRRLTAGLRGQPV